MFREKSENRDWALGLGCFGNFWAQNGPQTTRKSDISHGSPEEASSCRDTYMVEGPNLSEVDMPTRVRRVRA